MACCSLQNEADNVSVSPTVLYHGRQEFICVSKTHGFIDSNAFANSPTLCTAGIHHEDDVLRIYATRIHSLCWKRRSFRPITVPLQFSTVFPFSCESLPRMSCSSPLRQSAPPTKPSRRSSTCFPARRFHLRFVPPHISSPLLNSNVRGFLLLRLSFTVSRPQRFRVMHHSARPACCVSRSSHVRPHIR